MLELRGLAFKKGREGGDGGEGGTEGPSAR